MSVKKATRIMWEAHTKGKAIAKRCHKELAELYEERLRAYRKHRTSPLTEVHRGGCCLTRLSRAT